MVRLPPDGIASDAFTARFIMTCSICPGSALIRPSDSPARKMNAMSSRTSRFRMLNISETSEFRFSTLGCNICIRLNANNWRVRDAARSLAFSICRAFPYSGLAGSSRSSIKSPWPLITVSRLLKSCATPPASRPIASILCALRSWSCSCSCSCSFDLSVPRIRPNACVTCATSSVPLEFNGYSKSPFSSARTPSSSDDSGRVNLSHIKNTSAPPASTANRPNPASMRFSCAR